MSTRRLAATALSLLIATSTSACYHAVVDTGRPASPEVIDQPWAMSFVYGLVPPPMIETASRCPNGVSRVETQHSFLNGLVAAVTFGIVTPMQLTVTCASGSGGGASASIDAPTVQVAPTASTDQKADAFNQAARLAAQSGGAAYVQF